MSQADSLRHIADLWDALTNENDKLKAEVRKLEEEVHLWHSCVHEPGEIDERLCENAALRVEIKQLIGIMEKSGDPVTQFAASMCRGKPAKLSIRGDIATFEDMTLPPPCDPECVHCAAWRGR